MAYIGIIGAYIWLLVKCPFKACPCLFVMCPSEWIDHVDAGVAAHSFLVNRSSKQRHAWGCTSSGPQQFTCQAWVNRTNGCRENLMTDTYIYRCTHTYRDSFHIVVNCYKAGTTVWITYVSMCCWIYKVLIINMFFQFVLLKSTILPLYISASSQFEILL